MENYNFNIQEELKKLPGRPGVYLMHDETDQIIYVGKAADMCYHLFDLNPFIPTALEILSHTVFQADCLAHIDDRIPLIVHNVHTRQQRKCHCFFAKL